MSHHETHAFCQHGDLKYCRPCNVVYCRGCQQEWRQGIYWYNYTYPTYYPQWISSGGTSITTTGGSHSVTPTFTSALACGGHN